MVTNIWAEMPWASSVDPELPMIGGKKEREQSKNWKSKLEHEVESQKGEKKISKGQQVESNNDNNELNKQKAA